MSFKVRLEPSGNAFTVAQNEVILDAAIRHGLSLQYGCRNGVCGACKAKVVEGEIRYDNGLPAALNEAEDAVGQVLLCSAKAVTDLVIEAHEIGSGSEVPVRKMPARVVKLERLATDVMRLYLKLPDSERLQFLAGQYLDILLPDGRRRSFSMANPPHDDALIELHVRLIEGGEFTAHVFNRMQEKDILRIEGPYGSFTLQEDSQRPMIFIAGGTGLAPIKAIIEHALQEGVTRPMHIYWGVRAPADLYLADLPRAWAQHANIRYTPVLSEPRPEDNWPGRRGLVHDAVLQDFDDLFNYDVYASGPPAMVEAVRQGVILKGLASQHFFFDSFDFAEV
ncbi:CDP-6-deoxy-delta-3,4-glucoseen reductase [Candidatus Tenderia electrophaga]|jgi:CDP-4-dehydro-6-deoxyglucose reductase|uniref:CDP-6-deoxy-delta-3,4-glucoseen reductase n=1 Tax=Candidatus Tenderia electrophaga TaxID=1748243 RepID=A0A0S2TA96_9GAMM|nr:CDP-6-deoxy-delta-3,4-glucoseen reductase [Candidatus Tenderia electrophaga]